MLLSPRMQFQRLVQYLIPYRLSLTGSEHPAPPWSLDACLPHWPHIACAWRWGLRVLKQLSEARLVSSIFWTLVHSTKCYCLHQAECFFPCWSYSIISMLAWYFERYVRVFRSICIGLTSPSDVSRDALRPMSPILTAVSIRETPLVGDLSRLKKRNTTQEMTITSYGVNTIACEDKPDIPDIRIGELP